MLAALEKIQYMPRESGENAIPEIGAILDVVKAAGIARQNREQGAGRTVFVVWNCPTCRYDRSAFVEPNDMSGRRCYKDGTMMNEVHRGRVS